MNAIGIYTFAMMMLRFMMFLISCFLILISVFGVVKSFLKKEKRTFLKSFIYIILCSTILFLAVSQISGKQKINVESLNNTCKSFLELQDSYYEFDTGYITGTLSVTDVNGEHYYGPPFVEIIETGKLDSNVNYYFSKISYTKDERWFYLFCPTASEATIVFNNNEKLVYIDYYYTDKTLASFLWFFTNPELFYKHTVDFNDILSALQVQSEVIL